MVSRIEHPLTGRFQGVHVTFLDGDRKAAVSPDKIMRGIAGGGLVRLAEPTKTLALAEGIESALSFAQLARVPTWAALNAGNFSNVKLPTSIQKRCGKSTLLGVIEPKLPRALSVENITTSALFRTIEAAQPTLLLDEANSFLTTNEEMRGLLNAGHARGGTLIKAVGEDFEPRQFTVWAATVTTIYRRFIPARLADNPYLEGTG